jgi:hypothetical protein
VVEVRRERGRVHHRRDALDRVLVEVPAGRMAGRERDALERAPRDVRGEELVEPRRRLHPGERGAHPAAELEELLDDLQRDRPRPVGHEDDIVGGDVRTNFVNGNHGG